MPTDAHTVLAFDIYGTLLDTSAMSATIMEVQPAVNKSLADQLCLTWRKYQLEYTWRLNSMGIYEPFDAVTKRALRNAIAEHQADFLESHVDRLLSAYNELRPFPGAQAALKAISKIPNVKLVVFSNGTLEMVTSALRAADITGFIDGLFVVDTVQAYKPVKKVYEELVKYINSGGDRLAGVSVTPDRVWLVSGNPFDVTGARNAGLNALWINRSPSQGWIDQAVDLKPSKVVHDLGEIAHVLQEMC